MKKPLIRLAIASGLALSLTGPAGAVIPPPFINYQGVLRDSAGVPITGDRDMVFRFYTDVGSGCPPVGGTPLLEDYHLASSLGAVSVSGGLFSVLIGSGDVVPVNAFDLYSVFRYNQTVALEVEIDGEVLCPRTYVAAAPNAINAFNATTLDNQPPSNFLDTSSSSQVKAGTLTLLGLTSLASVTAQGDLIVGGDASIAGGDLQLGNADIHSAATFLSISSADPTNDLVIYPGPSAASGGLQFNGGGVTNLYAGNGNFQFWNGSNSGLLGSIFSNGDYVTGGALRLLATNGPALAWVGNDTRLSNPFDSGNLKLWAGNDTTDGAIEMFGNGSMDLWSGSGSFNFHNGANGAQTGTLDSSGNLQIDGDLTVSGLDVTFGPGEQVRSDGSDTELWADQDVEFMIDRDSSGAVDWVRIYHDNNLLNTGVLASFEESGNLRIRGTLTQNVAFDLAETFVMSEPLAPGDVVRVDGARGDAVRRATSGDGGLVVGVVSSRPGIVLGGAFLDRPSLGVWGPEVEARFDAEQPSIEQVILATRPELRSRGAAQATPDGAREGDKLESLALEEFGRRHFAAVALAGRVPVNVDAGFGSIAAGDPLGASPVPGVARKARPGDPIVGTALERLDHGRGSVLALVHRDVAGGRIAATEAAAPATDLPPAVAALPAPAIAPVQGIDAEASLRRPPEELAARFHAAEPMEVGDVVVADAERPGHCRLARAASDAAVIGVVVFDPAAEATGEAAIAVAGTVRVKADAFDGAIRVGDLLTTSPTPGHAMRSTDHAAGTVLGKALEPLDSATGVIRILVMSR